MFKTTLIAAMTFASMQAIEIRSESSTMWDNESFRNHLISLGIDPDTGLYVMAQTESSSGQREAEACREDCSPGDWDCLYECMDDGREA